MDGPPQRRVQLRHPTPPLVSADHRLLSELLGHGAVTDDVAERRDASRVRSETEPIERHIGSGATHLTPAVARAQDTHEPAVA